MRALCVARHQVLSDHISSYFRGIGLETIPVVGCEAALASAHEHAPDIVLCDYDLLVRYPLAGWECDERISRLPVIAVSLTRRPTELHALDVNGIAGFLYLPTLTREEAAKVVTAAGTSAPPAPSLPSVLDRSPTGARP